MSPQQSSSRLLPFLFHSRLIVCSASPTRQSLSLFRWPFYLASPAPFSKPCRSRCPPAAFFPFSSLGSRSRYSRYTSYGRKMLNRPREVQGPRAPPCRSSGYVVRDSSFTPLNNINGGLVKS
jgi:hypothetical protein